MTDRNVFIHPTADVSDQASIGPGTKVWHQSQVREGAVIGKQCILGKGAYVDTDVRIGDLCKLENGVSVFHGFTVEDGVFIGPHAILLNDRHPRAINPDGSAKTDADWTPSRGVIAYGAAIGGGAVVLPGVTVGRFALVGAGSVVTRDVPERGIVVGNPARLRGYACDCGRPLEPASGAGAARHVCRTCGREFAISRVAMAVERP